MASQEGFALKTIELGRCMICGCEKEEHHNYEPEIMLAPDNCVCFDDENWKDLYNEDGVRCIPEVCNDFEYDADRIGCINCCHDLECHKRT
jgi:hypothetical protein